MPGPLPNIDEQIADAPPLPNIDDQIGDAPENPLQPAVDVARRIGSGISSYVSRGTHAVEDTMSRAYTAGVPANVRGLIDRKVSPQLEILDKKGDVPIAGDIVARHLKDHPAGTGWGGAIYEGLAQTGASFTSPKALLMLGALRFAPEDAAPLVDTYFSGSMTKSAAESFSRAWDMFRDGDHFGAKKAVVGAAVEGGMAMLPLLRTAAGHAAKEKPEPQETTIQKALKLAKELNPEPETEAAKPAEKPAETTAAPGEPLSNAEMDINRRKIAEGWTPPPQEAPFYDPDLHGETPPPRPSPPLVAPGDEWTPEKGERRLQARPLTPASAAQAKLWVAQRRAQDAALDAIRPAPTPEDLAAFDAEEAARVPEVMPKATETIGQSLEGDIGASGKIRAGAEEIEAVRQEAESMRRGGGDIAANLMYEGFSREEALKEAAPTPKLAAAIERTGKELETLKADLDRDKAELAATPEEKQHSGKGLYARIRVENTPDLIGQKQAEHDRLTAWAEARGEERRAAEPVEEPAEVDPRLEYAEFYRKQQERIAAREEQRRMDAEMRRSRFPSGVLEALPARAEVQESGRQSVTGLKMSLPPVPERGYFEPGEVPQKLVDAANRHMFLRELIDSLEGVKGIAGRRWSNEVRSESNAEWQGAKSILPKNLQKGKKYSEIQVIIGKMLDGKKLTEGQAKYAEQLWEYAGENVDHEHLSVDSAASAGIPVKETHEPPQAMTQEDPVPDWVTDHHDAADMVEEHHAAIADAMDERPTATRLREPEKFGWNEEVLYNGKSYRIADPPRGNELTLMAGEGKNTEMIKVSQDDPGLETVPQATREWQPAVKLDDGSIIIGSRPTHQDLVNDVKATGHAKRVIDTGDWNESTGEWRTDPPDLKELFLKGYAEMFKGQGGAVRLDLLNPLMWKKLGAERKAVLELMKLKMFNRGLFARHNIHVLEAASPQGSLLARVYASARGAAQWAVGHDLAVTIDASTGKSPTELKAIMKSGGELPHQKFLRAVSESLREGNIKVRAQLFAQKVNTLAGTDLLKEFKGPMAHYFYDWLKSEHMKEFTPEEKAKMARQVSSSFKKGNAEGLREPVRKLFEAVHRTTPDMSPEMRAYVNTNEFAMSRQAAEPFLRGLEGMTDQTNPLQKIDPVFMGPAQTYLPSMRDPLEGGGIGPRRGAPYAHRTVSLEEHRTSLAPEQPSIANLERAWMQARRASALNKLTQVLVDGGHVVVPKPGKAHPEVMDLLGVSEPTERLQMSPSKERFNPITEEVESVPGKTGWAPRSLVKELNQIYDFTGRISDKEGVELAHSVLGWALRGPIEPALHGRRVIANLAHATAQTYPQAVARLSMTDLKSPEAIAEMRWQTYEAGLVHNRFGSVSASKLLAEQFGAEHEAQTYKGVPTGQFSPTIYGPYGIDARARVGAGLYYNDMVAKGTFPNDPVMKAKFIDGLGVYQNQLRNGIQRAFQKAWLQPFVGARGTAARAMLDSLGLWESVAPVKGMDRVTRSLRNQVANYMIGGVATWMAANYAMTGKLPDKDSKFGQVPVSKKNGKTQYTNVMALLFPSAYGFSTATGINRTVNTLLRGGNAKQASEQWAAGLASYLLGWVASPVSSATGAAVGIHPYVTSFHDMVTGKAGKPEFMSSLPPDVKGPGLHILPRALAGASEIAPFLSGIAEYGTPKTKAAERADAHNRSKLARAVASLSMGVIGSEEDTAASRARLKRDQKKRK